MGIVRVDRAPVRRRRRSIAATALIGLLGISCGGRDESVASRPPPDDAIEEEVTVADTDARTPEVNSTTTGDSISADETAAPTTGADASEEDLQTTSSPSDEATISADRKSVV